MDIKEINKYLERNDLSETIKKQLEAKKELLLTGKIIKK